MDVIFGIILGILGYAIVLKFKEYQENQKKPKRGRPPKKIEVKDNDPS